jgi:hypothetical protein
MVERREIWNDQHFIPEIDAHTAHRTDLTEEIARVKRRKIAVDIV